MYVASGAGYFSLLSLRNRYVSGSESVVDESVSELRLHSVRQPLKSPGGRTNVRSLGVRDEPVDRRGN